MMKEEEKKKGLREQELNGKLYQLLVDMNRYKWRCIMFLGLSKKKSMKIQIKLEMNAAR